MDEKIINSLLQGTTIKKINGEEYFKVPFTLIRTNKQLSAEGGWTMILNDMIRIIKNASEFKIYVYLCSLWNKDTKRAFPSIAQICDECSISESTVKRSIKELEKMGAIKVSKNKSNASSQWIHNSYEIFYFSQYEQFKYFKNKESLVEKLENVGLMPICNENGYIIDVIEIEEPYDYDENHLDEDK